MGLYWGANTAEEAVGRIAFIKVNSAELGAGGTPRYRFDDDPQEKFQVSIYDTLMGIFGRAPTGGEFAAGYIAGQQGSILQYATSVKATYDARDAAAKAEEKAAADAALNKQNPVVAAGAGLLAPSTAVSAQVEYPEENQSSTSLFGNLFTPGAKTSATKEPINPLILLGLAFGGWYLYKRFFK